MRIIGIRHRIKTTAEQEARPTQVVILSGDDCIRYDLEDEQAELDFLLGRFPIDLRKTSMEDDLSAVLPHHITWRRLKKDEDVSAFPSNLVRTEKSDTFVATKIPQAFDGLAEGDRIAMILGGSGDYFAYALSRRGTECGATVYRIPPFVFFNIRGEADKDRDSELLAQTFKSRPDLFYPIHDRDRGLILSIECQRQRIDAMRARIACEQRLRQRIIGQIFCSPQGFYPEGGIEKYFDEQKASDRILTVLEKEEAARNRDLLKALEALDVYQTLFAPIEGVGPAIAARLITAIQDIRRFETDAKLKAFCGVHVLDDGRFVRRRAGSVANWHPDARQALYLLGDQFNRRPNSEWGQYLLQQKRRFRETHPEPIVIDGKKKYTDGHIHKMALWRTITRFVERLHRDWWALEKRGELPKRLAA